VGRCSEYVHHCHTRPRGNGSLGPRWIRETPPKGIKSLLQAGKIQHKPIIGGRKTADFHWRELPTEIYVNAENYLHLNKLELFSIC
jgi:hypothetical protein